MLIDSTLSWKYHISTVFKISRSIGIMYKLRPFFLHLEVMKNVYHSLISSHFKNAIEVWGSTTKSEFNKILILQKRALRLVTFNGAFLN